MSRGYRLVYAVYNRTSEDSIPYFAAAVVYGPKGGMIALDEFSYQQMIRASKTAHKEEYVLQPKMAVKFGMTRYVMIKDYKVDTLVNKVAEIYQKTSNKNVRVVKRNKEEARKIGRELEIE